jgi:inner membrane protein
VTARRLTPVALLIVVASADVLLRVLEPPYLAIAVFDWPAHMATAAIVLMNLRAPAREFAIAMLVASVAIDVDHLPAELGLDVLTPGTTRPVTHSLMGAAAVGLLTFAATRRRAVAAGVVTGVLAHFARDVATGDGVPLLWPATTREYELPYVIYITVLTLLVARASIRSPQRIGQK